MDSGRWWWTGRLGVLWFMALQRVRHDWATELIWIDINLSFKCFLLCNHPLYFFFSQYLTFLRLSEAWVDSYQMLKCDYPEAGYLLLTKLGFPGVSDSSVCLQCWRPEFHSWFGKIPWRRKWQSTPILLPEKFQGGRSLKGYSPWGCKELDTTEQLHFLSKLIYLYWNHLLLISWLS